MLGGCALGQLPSLQHGGLQPHGHHILPGMTDLDLSPHPTSVITGAVTKGNSAPDPCVCHELLPAPAAMSFALEVKPLFDGCWGEREGDSFVAMEVPAEREWKIRS